MHAALALVVVWSLIAGATEGVLGLPCLWFRWTGLYCPGCGGQRALHAVLHGEVRAAASLNLLAVVIVGPVALYAYVSYMLQIIRGEGLAKWQVRRRGWVLLALLVLAFTVGRNLPHPVGQWLAP